VVALQTVDCLLLAEGLDLLGLEDEIIDDNEVRVVVRCVRYLIPTPLLPLPSTHSLQRGAQKKQMSEK